MQEMLKLNYTGYIPVFDFTSSLLFVFSRIYDKWETEFPHLKLIINQLKDSCCVDSMFD